ncbi:conserved hypothetical protein [Vibrio crassostreae]|uniref:hypothetical protein n=1 Tax=Vibrio crassostreae TaxID=246167 RepID=UPI001BD48D50|nr:hypothetical protein [Vibrio crassostreae]CAK1724291.1 conserved hypothetical protein [Vibrio crassostreae]CAK1941173.1 conserved hypothetical protein [Vibrio crassostreae]CAK2324747.1 conserved hypothetical protein [Vibrio crassostreae]CAK2331797.1 conserved hypothetical protein [Vibrio crassostreae]CAK2390269.1 conserved hypothetical protein [Vibrio crassostreae]
MNIGDINIGELKPIPGLELCDEKEVFAFFGLASFNAQCAEKALVNFAMGYKVIDNSALTQEEWLEVYDGLNSHTFGRLLRQVKKKVDLPHELVTHLETTLKKRNWLAHDFFYDYAMHMSDTDGRAKMINELQELIGIFQIADHAVEKLSLKVWETMGITEDWLQNEVKIQLKKYQSKEA